MAKVEIVFPQMGESIVEGTISKWLKKPGDQVAQDETILEISTDKVDSEVPASTAGVLEAILVPEGERAQVGQKIGVIETDASKVDLSAAAKSATFGKASAVPKASAPVPDKQVQRSTATRQVTLGEPSGRRGSAPVGRGEAHNKKRFFSPLVRSIANQEGVSEAELFYIQGSGEEGRVTKDDLLRYLEGRGQMPMQGGGFQELPKGVRGALAGELSQATKKLESEGKVKIEKMDNMRRVIAERMWESKHLSPHVTSFHEVDVTEMVRYRESHKKTFQDKHDFKLTYTALIAREAVRSLEKFPYLNTSIEGDQVILHKEFNLGMAVSVSPLGLVVPVIKNADEKNMFGIAKAILDLATRGRIRKLTPDELTGSTFSITNLGTFGSSTGTPIINQPNVAILGLGAILKKPGVVQNAKGEDEIQVRHMMTLSLAYDHRLVDGALGGQYLADLANRLEHYEGEDY